MSPRKSLSDSLNLFSEYLYSNRVSDEMKANLLKDFNPKGKLTPEQGLKVYRRAQVFSLMDVLADIFPVLKRVLTDDVFNFCARNYVYQYPSVNYDLNIYGEFFPEFVQSQKELQEHGYLKDLGAFEYGLHQCYFAESDSALSLESFQTQVKQVPERVYLNFRKSARIMQMSFSVQKVWEVYQEGSQDENAQADEGEFHFILLQDDFASVYYLIENDFMEIIRGIQEKKPLRELAQLPSVLESPGLLNQALSMMIAGKWLAAFPK